MKSTQTIILDNLLNVRQALQKQISLSQAARPLKTDLINFLISRKDELDKQIQAQQDKLNNLQNE